MSVCSCFTAFLFKKPTILVSDVAESSNNLPPLRNLNGFDSAPKVVLTDEELHENAVFVAQPPRDIPRPQSIASTTSTENGDAADMSDSQVIAQRTEMLTLLHMICVWKTNSENAYDRVLLSEEIAFQLLMLHLVALQMIGWKALTVETALLQRSLLTTKDRRLKKLHFAANEFYSVQKLFLKYLRDMGEVYPEYVMEYGKRFGKDLLAHQGSQPHVVRQLQLHYEQLIRVHQLLLEEFSSRLSVWDSLKPNMADVIIKYADFLKICKPFLLEKSRFVQELTQLRIENKDFDNATVAFEQKIFNRGVGAVVQQLDQNGSEEQKKTLEAIAKLEKIAQSVNESMGLPSNEELFKLYDRFQCHFDVFYPGRRLIRQGEVFKQTRKEPQPRYLVLFSDILWICRVMSGFGSSGLFDMSRSYGIPIETVRTESNSHEDYEQQLYVKSKYKSLILIMSSARERSQWQKEIDEAREEKRKYRRRMNEAIERQRKQSLNPLAFETPVSEDNYVADECHNGSSDRVLPAITCDLPNGQTACNGHHLAMSRRNSDSQDSSHPSTPVDDTPGPSVTSSVTGKRKVLRADTMKPLWIPDDSATKCLMEGCDTEFTFLHRRHHCRNCGWLICSDCVGKAPLSKFQFKKEIVCPECYDILSQSNALIQKSSLVEPQTLFVPPVNRRLKRMNVKERMLQNNGLVFGKVVLKTAKGAEVLRYAQLSDGMVLKFYRAPFDHEPCEQYVIYGFKLRETEMEGGGAQFDLVHRNQIRTDRKEHVISFRVEHEKSVNK
ncbi:unnamed protein product [Angiostrongylus costaricensis]|uniref:DH domain-containing protein n=1 Tax=Angiostrongylus costaricensis TaxID=334426 RepID=A0A0R3PS93_ANGCS|nr:unnamed protein product [Angiostrongylus costaricensis]